MDKQHLITAVNEIFIKVLDNPLIVLQKNTTAQDIPEWDSLTYIQLIYAIEKHFGIRFTTVEITRWKNVGELCDSIAGRLDKK